MKWIKRNSMIIAGAFSVLLLILSPALHLPIEWQGGLNVLIVAIATAVAQWGVVSGDTYVPIALGVVKAVLALGLAFGLHYDPALQVEIIAACEGLFTLIAQNLTTSKISVTGQGAIPS